MEAGIMISVAHRTKLCVWTSPLYVYSMVEYKVCLAVYWTRLLFVSGVVPERQGKVEKINAETGRQVVG